MGINEEETEDNRKYIFALRKRSIYILLTPDLIYPFPIFCKQIYNT